MPPNIDMRQKLQITSKSHWDRGPYKQGVKERFGPILSCNTTSDHWVKRGWTVFSCPVLDDTLIFTTYKAYELTVKVETYISNAAQQLNR